MSNNYLENMTDIGKEDSMANNIERLLDGSGKVKQWPSKQNMKEAICEYLATKFAWDVQYTEKQVNELLMDWHTFNDYFLLRRTLVERGYLCRKKDGSQYWKSEEKQT